MPARHRGNSMLFATALLVLLGCVLGACGDGSNDSKLLSPASASQLRSTLAQVEQTVESGDCAAAQEQVSLLQQQVTSLDRVEADLRDALAGSASRLERLVAEECQAPAVDSGATGVPGPAETGTTGGEEQQPKEKGNKKDKKNKKDGQGDEDGGQLDEGGSGDDSGGSGGEGSTGSGGFAP